MLVRSYKDQGCKDDPKLATLLSPRISAKVFFVAMPQSLIAFLQWTYFHRWDFSTEHIFPGGIFALNIFPQVGFSTDCSLAATTAGSVAEQMLWQVRLLFAQLGCCCRSRYGLSKIILRLKIAHFLNDLWPTAATEQCRALPFCHDQRILHQGNHTRV